VVLVDSAMVSFYTWNANADEILTDCKCCYVRQLIALKSLYFSRAKDPFIHLTNRLFISSLQQVCLVCSDVEASDCGVVVVVLMSACSVPEVCSVLGSVLPPWLQPRLPSLPDTPLRGPSDSSSSSVDVTTTSISSGTPPLFLSSLPPEGCSAELELSRVRSARLPSGWASLRPGGGGDGGGGGGWGGGGGGWEGNMDQFEYTVSFESEMYRSDTHGERHRK